METNITPRDISEAQEEMDKALADRLIVILGNSTGANDVYERIVQLVHTRDLAIASASRIETMKGVVEVIGGIVAENSDEQRMKDIIVQKLIG